MPKDSNSFKQRFQYYKQTGKLPYKAGRVNEELATDAIQSQQMPIELQQDPLGMQKRLDIARANAAKVTAMQNQAQVGTKTDVSQQLQNYYADKEDTRRFMERKRTGEELADKIMGTALDVATLYVPAARVGWNMMKGAAGALKSGVRATARGVKNAAETLGYGALGKPRVSKDYTGLVIPNTQEQSLYLKPSSKQTRIIKEDTYPTYIGPKHSVSEVVNADGTVNPRAAMKIQHEVADNIPGAYRMEDRLENPVWHINDPTTYHHTRDVAQRAWKMDTPSGYTKQDQMIAALGHDFGKIVTGDGHAKIGADLLRQIFPDITDQQLLAIREHMGQNLTTHLSVATKRADNGFRMNDIRYTPGPTNYTFTPDQYLVQMGLKNYLSGDRSIAARMAASRYGNQGALYNKYPQSTLSELTNTIIPRLKANRPWMNDREIENLVLQNQKYGIYPSEMFDNAGLGDALGVHFSHNDGIAIKAGYGGTSERHVIPHEVRHRIDDALPLTELEDKVLADAYDNDFLEVNSHFGGKQYDASVERVTTNSDARAQLLGNVHLEKTPPQLQNKIIDKVSDEQIFEAVENANGYGQAFIKRLRRRGLLTHEKAELFRQAMKVVPVALPFALMTTHGLSQPTIQQK